MHSVLALSKLVAISTSSLLSKDDIPAYRNMLSIDSGHYFRILPLIPTVKYWCISYEFNSKIVTTFANFHINNTMLSIHNCDAVWRLQISMSTIACVIVRPIT